MATLSIWACVLFIWMALERCAVSGGPCGSVEEGTTGALDCRSQSFTDSIIFQLKRNNGEVVEVSSCNSHGACTSPLAPAYVSNFTTTQESDGSTQYHNQLYISNANRSETNFTCLVDGRIVGECYKEVYVKPQMPTCDPIELDNSGKYVNITCRSLKVWPGATTTIFYAGPQSDFPDPDRRLACRHYPSPTNPGYLAKECTLLASLSYFEPKIHSFFTQMGPILSDTERAVAEAATVSSDIVEIELKAPTAAISDDCPEGTDVKEGYIKSGSTATCKCELADVGYPPGQAQWYTDKGTKVGNVASQDRSSTMTLSYDPGEPSPRFGCRADTVLNVSSPAIIPYSPKFAFGPNSVLAESPEGNEFNLCPSEGSHLKTVTCKVLFDQVVPNASFNLTDNGIKVGELHQGKLISNFYAYNYQFRPSGGGSHHIVCKAENSLFPDISRETVYELDVKEPPSSAPVITVSGSQSVKGDKNITAIESTEVIVTCRVDGGAPPVSEVTLVCGSRSTQAQSKIAALDLEIKKSMDGQICLCSASHVSGCYDKESEIVLRVQEANSVVGGSTDDGSSTDDSWKMWLGIGLGAAALIIVVVTIFAVLLRRRRTPPTSNNTFNNNAYDPYSPTPDSLYYTQPPEYAPPRPTPCQDPGHFYDRISIGSAATYGENRFLDEGTGRTAPWTVDDDYINPK